MTIEKISDCRSENGEEEKTPPGQLIVDELKKKNVSGIVILVRAAAEILRRHHRIPRRDPLPGLPVAERVAGRHVQPAADRLRRVHREAPVRERAARHTGRGGCAHGRVGGVRSRLGSVEVGGELGVVVEALDVEGGEDGLLDGGGEGVAFVGGAGVEEGEGRVGEVDGEGVVG